MREETSLYVFHIHDWSPILCASCICGFLNTQSSVNTWKENLPADALMFYCTDRAGFQVKCGVGFCRKKGGEGKEGWEVPAWGAWPGGWTLKPPFFLPIMPPDALHWEPRPRRGRLCGVSGLCLGVGPSPAWPLPWIFWFTVEEHRTGWWWQMSECPPHPVKWMKHI